MPTFTQETDNFALAIHIFKLLMNGYTPFGGIIETAQASQAAPGVGDAAVRRDNYCFKPGMKHQSVAIPALDAFSREIKDLFTRAFIEGKADPRKRPSPIEWHSALTRYEQSLVTCAKNPLHQYESKNTTCPFCEADNRYAVVVGGSTSQDSILQAAYKKPPSAAQPQTTQSYGTSYNQSAQTKSAPVTSSNYQQNVQSSISSMQTQTARIPAPSEKFLRAVGILHCIYALVFAVLFIIGIIYFINNNTLFGIAPIVAASLLLVIYNWFLGIASVVYCRKTDKAKFLQIASRIGIILSVAYYMGSMWFWWLGGIHLLLIFPIVVSSIILLIGAIKNEIPILYAPGRLRLRVVGFLFVVLSITFAAPIVFFLLLESRYIFSESIFWIGFYIAMLLDSILFIFIGLTGIRHYNNVGKSRFLVGVAIASVVITLISMIASFVLWGASVYLIFLNVIYFIFSIIFLTGAIKNRNAVMTGTP